MKTQGLQNGAIDKNSKEAQGRFVLGHSKSVDLATRTIQGIASTIELDRDGEVILPSAFRKHLPRFLAGSSPLVAAHTHRTTTADPTQVGWILEMLIEKTTVPFSARFADDPDGPAERWWKLASDANGKGIAFSIGFIPTRWIYGSVADILAEFPELKKPLAEAGLKEDDRLRVYTEIELLELSCVPVPSNRGAQQKQPDSASSATPAVESEIRNLKSEIGNLKAEVLDRISELNELIMLGSVAPPVAASQDVFVAPPADGSDGKAGPGETDGAAGARDAARSLLKTCRQ